MMDGWGWLEEELRAGGTLIALKNEKNWDEEEDWEEDEDDDEDEWEDEDEEDDEDWDEWEEEDDDAGLNPRRSGRPFWD